MKRTPRIPYYWISGSFLSFILSLYAHTKDTKEGVVLGGHTVQNASYLGGYAEEREEGCC